VCTNVTDDRLTTDHATEKRKIACESERVGYNISHDTV